MFFFPPERDGFWPSNLPQVGRAIKKKPTRIKIGKYSNFILGEEYLLIVITASFISN